jgi:hypothetical protein
MVTKIHEEEMIMANNDKGKIIILEPISLVHYVVNMDIILTISPKSLIINE